MATSLALQSFLAPAEKRPRPSLHQDAVSLGVARDVLAGLHPTRLMQGEELLLAWGRAVQEVHRSLHAPVDVLAWARAEERRYRARAAWEGFLRALSAV